MRRSTQVLAAGAGGAHRLMGYSPEVESPKPPSARYACRAHRPMGYSPEVESPKPPSARTPTYGLLT